MEEALQSRITMSVARPWIVAYTCEEKSSAFRRGREGRLVAVAHCCMIAPPEIAATKLVFSLLSLLSHLRPPRLGFRLFCEVVLGDLFKVSLFIIRQQYCTNPVIGPGHS